MLIKLYSLHYINSFCLHIAYTDTSTGFRHTIELTKKTTFGPSDEIIVFWLSLASKQNKSLTWKEQAASEFRNFHLHACRWLRKHWNQGNNKTVIKIIFTEKEVSNWNLHILSVQIIGFYFVHNHTAQIILQMLFSRKVFKKYQFK